MLEFADADSINNESASKQALNYKSIAHTIAKDGVGITGVYLDWTNDMIIIYLESGKELVIKGDPLRFKYGEKEF